MRYDDMYSRQKRLQEGVAPDPFQYDSLSDQTRNKVCQIALATLGRYYDYLPVSGRPSKEAWDSIARVLRRSRGVFLLANGADQSAAEVLMYFSSEPDINLVLDVVQAIFRHIQNESDALKSTPYPAYLRWSDRQSPEDAITELNKLFREDRVGYQFDNGQIVRIDSQYMHAEVVKPALLVLTDPRFESPNNEFLKAHEHYRHGRYKECLVCCSSAFESTMKVICQLRDWKFENTAAASKLISVCLKNGLLPQFTQEYLNGVEATLKGVPIVRNKYGGHGQGSEIVEVPSHFASYVLHLTAANILLLVEAEKSLPPR